VPRPLKKIIEETMETWREVHSMDLQKFVRDAMQTDGYRKLVSAVRTGGLRADRQNLLKVHSELGGLLMEKFQRLFAELRAAVEEVANEQMPMGSSSVSKIFLNGHAIAATREGFDATEALKKLEASQEASWLNKDRGSP
jgi:hypothetical protein